MKKAEVTQDGTGRDVVRLTLDCGTRWVLEQSPDGRRLIVWAPDGSPLKVSPVVANVIELEGVIRATEGD